MAPKAKARTGKRTSPTRSSVRQRSPGRSASRSSKADAIEACRRDSSMSRANSSKEPDLHGNHTRAAAAAAAPEDAAATRLQRAVHRFLCRRRAYFEQASSSEQCVSGFDEHRAQVVIDRCQDEHWGLLTSVEMLDLNLRAATPLQRVIFLDIDGVLNIRGGDGGQLDDEFITTSTPFFILRRRCVQHLASLVRTTDARLVLSSTWRNDSALKHDLLATFVAHGLSRDVFVGQTPSIDFHRRPDEIRTWLDNHADAGIQSWVVLDDMRLGGAAQLKEHFVWVNPEVGLSDKDVEGAITILDSCKS